jgi:hypothetical protein
MESDSVSFLRQHLFLYMQSKILSSQTITKTETNSQTNKSHSETLSNMLCRKLQGINRERATILEMDETKSDGNQILNSMKERENERENERKNKRKNKRKKEKLTKATSINKTTIEIKSL